MSFAIGEKALVLPGKSLQTDLERYFGATVTVMEALERFVAMESGTAYHVRADDGCEFWICPSRLQKLPPPRDDLQLIEWSKCICKPEGVRA